MVQKSTEQGKPDIYKFDVVPSCPSISKTLFNNTINWAKQYHNFSEAETEFIQTTRKSFLYLNQTAWIQQEDGAECCELVDLSIHNKICNILQRPNVGLYWDDGLAAVSVSRPQIEIMRKLVFSMFLDI